MTHKRVYGPYMPFCDDSRIWSRRYQEVLEQAMAKALAASEQGSPRGWGQG